MSEIYYVNSQGKTIDFCQWPYMVTGGNIFDGSYATLENDDYIQGYERSITDYNLEIDINALGIEFKKAVDTLEDMLEYDVMTGIPGKLYAGDSYMKCWFTGTEKDRVINRVAGISNSLTIQSDYPWWITEKKMSFFRQEVTGQTSPWLEFPYDTPYEFSKVKNLQTLQNDHYMASGFKIIIYGPCINPLIRIAGHTYELRTTLYEGEYAVIDSSTKYAKDRSIIKVKTDGTVESIINSRNKDSDIWQKIPPGQSIVSWNGNFGFEIILFNERGTPRWISW